MKKLVAYLLTGTLIFALTACGGTEDSSGGSSTQSSESSVQSTAESSSEAGTTQEMESTQEAESTDMAESESIEENEVEQGWSEEMQTIKSAVVEVLGENYWPDTPISAEVLEQTFGVTSDMYDDYMGEMPMISVNIDTLVIVKAKEDKVQEVEDALTAYRQIQVDNTMQYPMNMGKTQASMVKTIGNYVCFVQLGADTMEAADESDEAVIKQCQEQNELVVEKLSEILQ